LVAAVRNAIERGFTVADLVFNLTDRGYDMVLVPKGMKNGIPVPLSPNELVQRIQKHQGGRHDQQSHGNWADSGSPKLKIIGQYQKPFFVPKEQTRVVRYESQNEKTDFLLYAKKGTKLEGISIYAHRLSSKNDMLETVGQLVDWDEDDGTSKIMHVHVSSSHRRRGIASAMLRLYRDMYPEKKIRHSESLTPDGRAWASVVKHQSGTHDQESHGNWADKLSGTRTGDNRLDLYESMELLKGQPDPQQYRVYEAQEKAFPGKQVIAPDFDNDPKAYGSSQEYNDAYKKYSKEYTAYVRAQTKNVISPLAKKHLNGMPKGVKNYIEEVIAQDWFVEAFGSADFFPTLEIKINQANVTAGGYFQEFNTRTRRSRHGITIGRNFAQDERLMLHEIAHYATAISATEKYQHHGREWAGNFLYILEKQFGRASAERLRKAFDKNKVEYTND
jgi:ribosomal protein S18 acetylase RimI-like enzyme